MMNGGFGTISHFGIEANYFFYVTTNRMHYDTVNEAVKFLPSDDLPKKAKKPRRFLAEDHHIRKVRK